MSLICYLITEGTIYFKQSFHINSVAIKYTYNTEKDQNNMLIIGKIIHLIL